MVIPETIIVAFSMFSAIPMPQIAWNEKNMRFSLCAFPLIGAVIGLLCLLWERLSLLLAFPPLLQAAGFCLIPVLITGGIHLDGYADTCDALASRASIQRRQEILKDPHLGAFAAIRLAVFFLASFALWTSLPLYRPWAVTAVFCLSRTLSGLSLTLFPLREGSGLARSFAEAADRVRVRNILIVMTLLFSILLLISGGGAALPAAALVFLIYYRTAVRKFGGLSGDLAGWFMQKAELWMLGAICLWQYVEVLL